MDYQALKYNMNHGQAEISFLEINNGTNVNIKVRIKQFAIVKIEKWISEGFDLLQKEPELNCIKVDETDNKTLKKLKLLKELFDSGFITFDEFEK